MPKLRPCWEAFPTHSVLQFVRVVQVLAKGVHEVAKDDGEDGHGGACGGRGPGVGLIYFLLLQPTRPAARIADSSQTCPRRTARLLRRRVCPGGPAGGSRSLQHLPRTAASGTAAGRAGMPPRTVANSAHTAEQDDEHIPLVGEPAHVGEARGVHHQPQSTPWQTRQCLHPPNIVYSLPLAAAGAPASPTSLPA